MFQSKNLLHVFENHLHLHFSSSVACQRFGEPPPKKNIHASPKIQLCTDQISTQCFK